MMEASEATESTEAQAPETDPTTDAPQEAQETESTEQTEAAPPQLNDAIQALQAQQAEILREVRGEEGPPDNLLGALTQPEAEYEDDPDSTSYTDQQQVEPGEDDQLESQLRELIREEATNLVGPYFQQQEAERRANEIRAFANEHPRLQEPEVMQAVATNLRDFARRNNNPALQTDPRLVEVFYKAYEADLRNTAETPAEAAGQGATLEAGAGPSAPTSEVDPVQAQYEKAIASAVGEDPLTR